MFYIYKDFDINICSVSKSIPFVFPYFMYSPGRYNLAIFLFLLKFVSAEGASRLPNDLRLMKLDLKTLASDQKILNLSGNTNWFPVFPAQIYFCHQWIKLMLRNNVKVIWSYQISLDFWTFSQICCPGF